MVGAGFTAISPNIPRKLWVDFQRERERVTFGFMSEKKVFDLYALSRQRAEEFGIERLEEESDENFKYRVAGLLRKQGHIIEAHEAFSGRLYDDPEQSLTGPMAGIIGVIAQAKAGREYSPDDPERQIGDDIASGVLAQSREKMD